MLRAIASVPAVLAFGACIAMADDFRAVVKKVDGNKVTFARLLIKFGPGAQAGPDMKLLAATDIKVFTGKFDKKQQKLYPDQPLEGGLKNKMFSNLGKHGIPAHLTTEGGQITQIVVLPQLKRKKKS